MRSPSLRRLAFLCVSACAALARAAPDEFSIETLVYVDNQEEPVFESLTLFSRDVAYDFLLCESEEIVVFDSKRGRLVVLDPKHRVQTTVTTEQIRQFTDAIRAYEGQGSLAFLLAPAFEAEFDEGSGWLTLASKQMTYRVKGIEPKSPGAVRRYQQFVDSCARFNATRPGNLPPIARIELNKAVAERGWIPSEVERTIRFADGPSRGKQLARSRHSANWRLSNTDRARIADVARYLASFRTVTLHDYQGLTTAASQGEASKR